MVIFSLNDMVSLYDPETANEPLPPSMERRTLVIHFLERFSADPVLIHGGEAQPIDPTLSQNIPKLSACLSPLPLFYVSNDMV